MKQYSLRCGKEIRTFSIPDEAIVEIAEPLPVKVAEDPTKTVRLALLNPIGTGRLREQVNSQTKVTVIANDITRECHGRILLPLIIDELHEGGVQADNITIVIATGTHRKNTHEEIASMFGDKIARKYQVINHDAYDRSGLISYGDSAQGFPITINRHVVEADFCVSIGSIEPHRLAGYSGGVKSVSVGTAGIETIEATHNVRVSGHCNRRGNKRNNREIKGKHMRCNW